MPNDPHTTLKFPKVVAIHPSPSSDSPSDNPERPSGSLSRPSMIPDGYGDDVATQRAMWVTVAAPAIALSSDRALLTILVGLNAGQVFTLDRDESFLGRGRDAEVRIDDVGVSRRHARIVRTEGRRYVVEDLGSANGVLVNGVRVERADLTDGDRLQVGPALVLRFSLIAADEEALARQLYESSTRDALTHIYNRKYAGERLEAEVAYAHRHGTLLSLVLFDLDHFKRINDGFGHPAGDAVLCVVAAQVQKAIRAEDVLARYGGEEFVVLTRGIEHKAAHVLADRIRRFVERLSIPWESQTLKATVSVGVASLSECGPKETRERLVALADERLYEAKSTGRNRVCAGVFPVPASR
jgi:diguanylate cyclase (GGDEF)-like protein